MRNLIKKLGKLPNLGNCLARAGFDKSVCHKALDDARDVIELLRHRYFQKEEKHD